MKTGKLISTEDGKTSAPQYGEVYTAPAGERGYIAGFRDRSHPTLFLFPRQFATLKAAQDYSIREDVTLAEYQQFAP